MRRHTLPFVLSCALALAARPAAAQSGDVDLRPPRPRYAVALVGGIAEYELAGTSTTTLVGTRVEAELRPWLVIEGALGYHRSGGDVTRSSRLTIPEVQMQLQLPEGPVRPYVGFGAGYAFGQGQDSEGTRSGAIGVRVPLPSTRVDLRGELRVRGVGSTSGTSSREWTVGAGYRF